MKRWMENVMFATVCLGFIVSFQGCGTPVSPSLTGYGTTSTYNPGNSTDQETFTSSGNTSQTSNPGSSGTVDTQPPVPSSPVPANGATNISISLWTNLDWAPVAHSYDVYFGTSPNLNSNNLLESPNGSNTRTFLNMAYSTTYYWQVIAKNGAKTTRGPVWSFTTEPNPGSSSDPGTTTELSEGVHDFTLQAAEAKRYTLNMQTNEKGIVNATMPDGSTDVDVHVYAPGGTQPIASSTNRNGLPDNVHFTAATSGKYALETVNISTSRSAQVKVNFQRIPSNTTSPSSLNGIYKIVEANGQSLPSTTSEWWVFSKGSLASFYGWLGAQDLNLPSDLQYWVDARNNEATELHYQSVDFTARIIKAETKQSGTSVTLVLEIRWDFTNGVDTVVVEQSYNFAGNLVNSGDNLEGNYRNLIKVDGETKYDLNGTMKLRRE